jgi:signal transduction histidine kinase
VTSVRRKVLYGALLWTFGMLAAFSVVLTYHHPVFDALRIVHAHAPFMGLLAILSMAAGAAVVRAAIAPLKDIRRNLSAVRNGSELRVNGVYPSEVQPLVDDLNALLEHLQNVVARAGTRAGDLAHGLKTPLAVLANEADRLTTAGNPPLAKVLTEQIGIMRRYVEYHLAHARAAASGPAIHARCSVSESVDGLVRTMHQLHADRRLTIVSEVDATHLFKGRREDLDEMLGNLLDNACKWATDRVAVHSRLHGDRVVVTIEDDGAGLDQSARQLVLGRGVRQDERVPGSGLGLAIVRDLAGLYGGSISLDRISAGGLAARLELPGELGDAPPEGAIIRPSSA